jgi:hypothetical protein
VCSDAGGSEKRKRLFPLQVWRLKVGTEIEGPDVMPTIIYPEAWDSAMVIDQAVYKFMAERGLRRVEGRSKMTEAIAKLVQVASNKSFARVVDEAEAEEAGSGPPLVM